MSPVLALHALQSQSANSHTPAVCFAVVSLPSPPISQNPNDIPSLWLRQALFFSFSISLTPATHSSVDLPQVAHAVMVYLPTQLWAIPVRQLAVPPSSKTDWDVVPAIRYGYPLGSNRYLESFGYGPCPLTYNNFIIL